MKFTLHSIEIEKRKQSVDVIFISLILSTLCIFKSFKVEPYAFHLVKRILQDERDRKDNSLLMFSWRGKKLCHKLFDDIIIIVPFRLLNGHVP